MFVGHALAAFAVVALLSRRRGAAPARALTVGAVAGLFAAVPDVDIVYALVGVASGLAADAGALALAETFWATGNVVHRTVTHSVVVAPVVALAVWGWVDGRPVARLAALALAAGLLAVATSVGGALAGAVTVAFVAAALALAAGVRRRTALSPRTIAVLALVGIVSHPFGDVFTGEPPALLHPLGPEVLTARVTLSADPTLHLLGAFAVELATVWAAVIVWSRLRAERDGRPVGRLGAAEGVDLRAVAGTGYAAGAFVIPAPTLELSYPFVLSVVAVGAVGAVPVRLRRRGRAAFAPEFARPGAERALFTGLTAVTLAAGAYLLTYLAGVA